ncbi:Crp/Fnr family transcriptional regulator [Belliella marina]|uniref:Crp/Fnr family transcriptional regulator n=1 Tax=Belliella marina TaxID=1644146 RepID=A0ABW4VMC9_9BACT
MKTQIEKIDQFIKSLDYEIQLALDSVSTDCNFKKGDIIVREGQVCKFSYHFIDGVGRKFYLDDTKEITTEFYFPDDLAVVFDSYVFQSPSKEYIECLSDVTLSITHFDKFNKLKEKYPKLVEFDLLMTEIYASWLEQRMFEFRTLDATQRYHKLLKSYPHFVKHISLTHIASYLGISLETLSRIRAKQTYLT